MNKLARLLALADLIDDDATPTQHDFPFTGPVAIRTVTLYYTGIVRRVTDQFVILGDAAWIPDAGRWSTFLSEGTPNEVEPFPDEVAVALGAIVDIAPWSATLPRKVK